VQERCADKNKCISKTHIWQTDGAVETMCNTLGSFSRDGNISVADCMHLSSQLYLSISI